MSSNDTHQGAKVFDAGSELHGASGALVLLHGRGGSAEDILSLGEAIAPSGAALIAPQASEHTWYPYSFLAPVSQNEPWLSSALNLIETLVQRCLTQGVPFERVVLCGFSQGACLATEFVAQHPRHYGALLAYTGGLIGPPGTDLHHAGNLREMPALFSSGDPDPHVPWERVEESARVLGEMGARVELKRCPGRPHTVLREEAEMGRNLLERVFVGR